MHNSVAPKRGTPMSEIQITYTVANGWSPTAVTSDLTLEVLHYIRQRNRNGTHNLILGDHHADWLTLDENGQQMRLVLELELGQDEDECASAGAIVWTALLRCSGPGPGLFGEVQLTSEDDSVGVIVDAHLLGMFASAALQWEGEV
jgi:hypothetical protein